MHKKLYQKILWTEDQDLRLVSNKYHWNESILGKLLHMGVISLPNLQDNWSRDPFLQSNGIWKHVMSRHQFLLLLHFLNFKDETNPESLLQKISPLINHLNNTMSKIYCPNENHSLDKSVVLWRGRLIFR